MKKPNNQEALRSGANKISATSAPRTSSKSQLQAVTHVGVFVREAVTSECAELAIPMTGLVVRAGNHKNSGPAADDG